jgi:hypothetical protein
LCFHKALSRNAAAVAVDAHFPALMSDAVSVHVTAGMIDRATSDFTAVTSSGHPFPLRHTSAATQTDLPDTTPRREFGSFGAHIADTHDFMAFPGFIAVSRVSRSGGSQTPTFS